MCTSTKFRCTHIFPRIAVTLNGDTRYIALYFFTKWAKCSVLSQSHFSQALLLKQIVIKIKCKDRVFFTSLKIYSCNTCKWKLSKIKSLRKLLHKLSTTITDWLKEREDARIAQLVNIEVWLRPAALSYMTGMKTGQGWKRWEGYYPSRGVRGHAPPEENFKYSIF